MTTPPTTPAASEGPYKVEDSVLAMIGGLCLHATGHRRTPCTAEDDECECCRSNRRIVQDVANTAHSSALASFRFTGRPWKTADGVYVARPDDIVYVYEATDGYSRWSGKIIPIKFSTWLDKSDPDWQGHPSTHLKRQCPDGAWNCYSTPDAAEGARLIASIAPRTTKGNA